MPYKVTVLYKSKYCDLTPRNPDCQRIIVVNAHSKADAVRVIHDEQGMVWHPIKKCTLPQVWSIEAI